jgi:tryptophanyl-tRNA synthetase
MRAAFAAGIGWGDAKKKLFELVNSELAPARERYRQLMEDPGFIEAELQAGAIKARKTAAITLQKVRDAVGISAIR